MLDVSVPTVREAVAELIALDIVEVRVGIGTFVSRRASDERRLLTAELRRASPRELAEVWALIERETAYRAAQRMSASRRSLRERHAEVVYAVLGGEADSAARHASLVARSELTALG